MEFQPLASSSAGCCYVLRSGDLRPLLLDCGLRGSVLEAATGFTLSRFAGCLLSHAHGDHAAGINHVQRRAVDVYASQQTFAALKNAVAHRSKVVAAGDQLAVAGWQVKAFEVVHDQPGTLGFVIDDQLGHRALYLTDSAYSPYRFAGLTHIFIECNWSEELMRGNHLSGAVHSSRFKRTVRTHMSLERLIEMLKANDLSKAQEIHLLHLSNENSDEEAFVRAVSRETGIPTYAAQS